MEIISSIKKYDTKNFLISEELFLNPAQKKLTVINYEKGFLKEVFCYQGKRFESQIPEKITAETLITEMLKLKNNAKENLINDTEDSFCFRYIPNITSIFEMKIGFYKVKGKLVYIQNEIKILTYYFITDENTLFKLKINKKANLFFKSKNLLLSDFNFYIEDGKIIEIKKLKEHIEKI